MKRQHLTVVMDGARPGGTTVAAEGEGLLKVRKLRVAQAAGELPKVEVEVLDLSLHAEVDGWVGTDVEYRARRWLEQLGKLNHPHAATDPVGALGQVAVDLQQCLNLIPQGRTPLNLALRPPVPENQAPPIPPDGYPPSINGDDH